MSCQPQPCQLSAPDTRPGYTSACPTARRCFYSLEAPPARVCGYDIPFPLVYEPLYLPTAPRIADAIRRTVKA